jgi:hypothetical protein
MAGSAAPLLGLTLGMILDRIFRLLRSHIRRFLHLALVPGAAMVAFYVLLGAPILMTGAVWLPAHAQMPASMLRWIPPSAIAGSLLMIVTYTLFEAAATYSALQANAGELVTFRSAYGLAWSRCGRFLWLTILRGLIVGLPFMAPFLALGGLTAIAVHSQQGQLAPGVWFLLFPLIVLLFAAGMVYAVLMSLRLALAPAACIAEGLTAISALKRSGELTREAKGRIFLVLLVVYAAGYVAMLLFELICMVLIGLGALAVGMLQIRFAPPWSYVGIGVLAVGGLALMMVWVAAVWSSYAVAFAVLYHDQRYRVDGAAPAALA